jgi:hypothetical protein
VISSRCASAACAKDKRGPKEEENGKYGGREKTKCLVGLKAVIVNRSTAHPADLAELLALFAGENFKLGSICIDKCAVVVIPVIGFLSVGMKRGAIRECLEDGLHCGENTTREVDIIVGLGTGRGRYVIGINAREVGSSCGVKLSSRMLSVSSLRSSPSDGSASAAAAGDSSIWQ